MKIEDIPTGLTDGQRLQWVRDNLSITDQATWRTAERQRNLIKSGKIKPGKRARLTLLKGQHNRCALCQEGIAFGQRFCLDKRHMTIICLSCNQLLTVYRKAQSCGLTEEVIEEYEQKT